MAKDIKTLITNIRGAAATAQNLIIRAQNGDSQAKSCLGTARIQVQSILDETGYALADMDAAPATAAVEAVLEAAADQAKE